MNAAELADHIAAGHAMNKSQAKQVVDSVFAAIVEAATKGEEVSVPGFGKFKVTSRDARTGRNPATGATIQIAASKKLGFAPAKQVKDALNVAPAKSAAKTAPKAAPKAVPAAKPKKGA